MKQSTDKTISILSIALYIIMLGYIAVLCNCNMLALEEKDPQDPNNDNNYIYIDKVEIK